MNMQPFLWEGLFINPRMYTFVTVITIQRYKFLVEIIGPFFLIVILHQNNYTCGGKRARFSYSSSRIKHPCLSGVQLGVDLRT